jgi:hypothetical protein
MTKKITLRDSGTVVEQEEFGRIYGGGMKKALDKPLTLKLGDHGDFVFTARDIGPLQEMVSYLVNENTFLREELNRWSVKALPAPTLQLAKPRYRVKAISVPVLSPPPVVPARAATMPPLGMKAAWDSYDPDLQVEVRKFPTKVRTGRHVFDQASMSATEKTRFLALQNRQYQRTFYRKKASK